MAANHTDNGWRYSEKSRRTAVFRIAKSLNTSLVVLSACVAKGNATPL